MKTDTELIKEYFLGNELSLETLIARHLGPLYNFITHFTGSPKDAEDITQETFVKMWKNLKRYNTEKSFKTWLFGIGRNTAIDWMRKKKSILFSEFENDEGENMLLETLHDTERMPDESSLQKETASSIANALETLSPDSRAIMILHYENQMTFKEISETLERSIDTIKSKHRRALIKLNKTFLKK